MKLLDFIPYLLAPDKLTHYYRESGISEHSVAPLIYMRDTLSLASDIVVFALEETSDDIRFRKNGVDYIQLIAVDGAMELIEGEFFPGNNTVSHHEIASRLLAYAIYDA